MQGAAHLALQGGVDELVLAHARQAAKGARSDPRLVVVAVAGEVLDMDIRFGKGLPQCGFQLVDGHRHAGRVGGPG